MAGAWGCLLPTCASPQCAADPATVIFDTNRLWCARLPALAELFPAAKIVCCVRPVSWIIDSIERQTSRNPFELSGVFAYQAGGTIYTRATRVAGSDGMVGYALDALREACFGPFSDRLILLDYETFVRAPVEAIGALYRAVGPGPVPARFRAGELQRRGVRRGAGQPRAAPHRGPGGVAAAPDRAAA